MISFDAYTTKKARVFWTGGEMAKKAAENFAKEIGGTTLEMTEEGQRVEALTKDMDWVEARDLWIEISIEFAKSADEEVYVFQTSKGISLQSIWYKTELPYLNNKKINYFLVVADDVMYS